MCAHAPNAANKILLASAVIRSGIMVLMQNVASTVADAAYPRKSIHVIADLLLVLGHRTPEFAARSNERSFLKSASAVIGGPKLPGEFLTVRPFKNAEHPKRKGRSSPRRCSPHRRGPNHQSAHSSEGQTRWLPNHYHSQTPGTTTATCAEPTSPSKKIDIPPDLPEPPQKIHLALKHWVC